ncbi:hypothetical protein EON64_18095 [archaeon]|nr:MAG: hypothetical protein EON64_18095 [archaeon]
MCKLHRQLSNALDRELTFSVGPGGANATREEVNRKMSMLSRRLDGLKRSIEYLQDYVNLSGKPYG